jgi:hypothetical protein
VIWRLSDDNVILVDVNKAVSDVWCCKVMEFVNVFWLCDVNGFEVVFDSKDIFDEPAIVVPM